MEHRQLEQLDGGVSELRRVWRRWCRPAPTSTPAEGKYGSALQMAAKSGNLEATKWLLEHAAGVEAREKKQWNVLSYLWRVYGKA